MKKILLGYCLLFSASCPAQLFQQDFQSSLLLGAYQAASPSNGQFNAISTSGAGTVVAIAPDGTNNLLRYTRSANTGSFSRTTDLTGAGSLMYQFNLSVNASSTTTSAAVFQVGSGFGTANTAETNANTYARIGINTSSTGGTFALRDIASSTNSPVLSGTQTILWVLNNTGVPQTYRAPSGTEAAVGNDKADLWAGTSLLFNDVDVQTPAQAITDLKFVFSSGTGTIDIDNILADPIPPVAASAAATAVSDSSFTAQWTEAAGVSGYRLDVSAASDFSVMLPGYDHLYIPGAATHSFLVSGLQPGTSYYYRVRSAVQYPLGELGSGNSTVQTVLTTQAAALPVTMGMFTAAQNRDGIQLQWNNLTETDILTYSVERSDNGRNFISLALLLPHRNDGGIAAYQYLDAAPFSGQNYYRVKAEENTGKVWYSSIIRMDVSGGRPSLHLYPNPLAGGQLGLQLNQLPKGSYRVRITNMSGQMAGDFPIRHQADGSFSLWLPAKKLSAGRYVLELRGPILLRHSFIVQ